LVEDHTVVRQGLRLLVETDGDIEVVGEAKTGREAVQMTGDLRPDIVLMDIAMPSLNGLQATRQILKAFPATKVLILSAHSDPEYVEQVVKVGAMGYLVKQSSGEVVTKAIRELQKGKTFFSSSVIEHLNDDYRKSPDGVGLRKKSEAELTCGGQRKQTDRLRTRDQHQNGRKASSAPDGEVEYPRHCRLNPLRYCRRNHRKQRAVNVSRENAFNVKPGSTASPKE
jgi:DNA-binding NarL/FixJ family response regulator